MTDGLVPVSKLVPFTVSVKSELPAPMLEGWSELIVGAGGCAALTVNKTILESAVVPVAVTLEVPETAEPGIMMVTWIVPGVATSEEGTTAVNVVALTKVVVSGFPFHMTVAPETN